MGHDSLTSRTFVLYFPRSHQVNEIFLDISFNKWILHLFKQRRQTEEANETIIFTVQGWKIEIFDISMILLANAVKIFSKISISFFNPALVLCLGVLAFLGAEEE